MPGAWPAANGFPYAASGPVGGAGGIPPASVPAGSMMLEVQESTVTDADSLARKDEGHEVLGSASESSLARFHRIGLALQQHNAAVQRKSS
jgi:hypothetical protein